MSPIPMLFSLLASEQLLRLMINLMVLLVFVMPLVIGIRKLVAYLKSEEVHAKLVEIKYQPDPECDDPNTVAVYEYEKNGEKFRVNSDWLEFDKNLKIHVYRGKVYKLQNVLMYLLIVVLSAIVFFVLVNFVFLGKYAEEVKAICLKLIPAVFSLVAFSGGIRDVAAYLKGQTVRAKIVDIQGEKPKNGERELVYPVYEYESSGQTYRIVAENPVYITNTDFIGKEKNIRLYNGRIVDPVMILLYVGVSVAIGGVLFAMIQLLT